MKDSTETKHESFSMEETEYNERLKKIESDFEQAKKQLYIDYGMSRRSIKRATLLKIIGGHY